MKTWTYLELKTKVEQDLAIEEETFIQPNEMLGYFNEGVDQAEQEIITLYEDYFLTRATLALVQGTEEYSLPADIYAEKIRRAIFRNNGGEYYTVNRIRDWKKFEEYTSTAIYGSSDNYSYFLYNPGAGQSKFLLVPTSRDTGSFITLWYIRNAAVFTGEDDDILDMPEAANFIMRFVKNKIISKDLYPSPLPPDAVDAMETERDLFKSTLANMVPDANNEIEPDFSHYEEMN